MITWSEYREYQWYLTSQTDCTSVYKSNTIQEQVKDRYGPRLGEGQMWRVLLLLLRLTQGPLLCFISLKTDMYINNTVLSWTKLLHPHKKKNRIEKKII